MENVLEDRVGHCRIDKSGRVVLPQWLRHGKNLNCGEELIVSIEDGAIVMRTYDEVIERIQHKFKKVVPDGVSLMDDLISDRKTEALLEARR